MHFMFERSCVMVRLKLAIFPAQLHDAYSSQIVTVSVIFVVSRSLGSTAHLKELVTATALNLF
jgi:citrate synthase